MDTVRRNVSGREATHKKRAMMTPYRCAVRYGGLAIVALVVLGFSAAPGAAADEASGAGSRFASELTKENYEEIAPPATPPVFRWDFSRADVVHTYSYQQEVRSATDLGAAFGGPPDAVKQEVSSAGVLLIRSQGGGTGELVLKDVKMRMKTDAAGESEAQTMDQTMPPIVVQGLQEDGSGGFGDSTQDVFLKMLFQLPPRPLDVGEAVDVPAQMPFHAMGSTLQVKGRFRIILKRYVKIGGTPCAELGVDTDVSQLDVPPELKGEYRCSLKGTSVFYFDVEHRVFRSGTTALVMQAVIDAPMPKMKIPGGAAPDLPERSKMSMRSDNLIRVRLQE